MLARRRKNVSKNLAMKSLC